MSKKKVGQGSFDNDSDKIVADRDADFSELLGKDGAGQPAQGQDEQQERSDASASPEQQIVTLQEGNNKLAAEAALFKDKYIRALADLENYRKRTMKERSDLLKYQGEPILYDVLEVVDNLERALAHSESESDQLKEGLEMIYRRFIEILGKWEVRSDSAVGQQFDPVKHNALSRIAVEGTPAGSVISELKKAYFYKDKILRHAEVVVAAGQEERAESADNSG